MGKQNLTIKSAIEYCNYNYKFVCIKSTPKLVDHILIVCVRMYILNIRDNDNLNTVLNYKNKHLLTDGCLFSI